MATEAEIAAQLQKNIPAPEPQSPTEPTEPQTPREPDETGFVSDMGENINMYRLYDYFHVEPAFRHGDTEQKIAEIYRWAAMKAQSTDYLQVANVLTAYSQGMGAGSLDSNNLNRIYEWIQLDKQINRLKQEQAIL